MALSDSRLPLAQQENLLAILAHSDEYGKLVAQIADPELFEGDYRVIAERCVDYWRKHEEAPKVHTSDLFVDILEDAKNRKAATFRNVLTSMIQLNDEGVNSRYVLDELTTFIRNQKRKQAIHHAAELVNSPLLASQEEADAVLHEMLQARDFRFDPGMRLTDVDRMLAFLQSQQSEFVTGISVLDKAYIVPMRRKIMLLAAPSGFGKTWMLINAGKHNLIHNKRVLHLTGELDEEDVAQRYFQALFAVTTREESGLEVTELKRNREGELTSFKFDDIQSDFTFESESIRDELMIRIEKYGPNFFSKLIIKRFPDGGWSPNDLRGYLDSLEATEGFFPDLILFDSPYQLRISGRDPRLGLIENLKASRAIAEERNAAMIATHQVNEEGARASQSRGGHLAEAKAIKWNVDNLLTFSQTDMERRYGLARMYVDKARKESDRFGLLITQNYKIGQFCLSSMRLSPRYFDVRKDMEDREEEGDEDKDQERPRGRSGFVEDEED